AGPPGVAPAAASNTPATQSQNRFRARWRKFGSFSWYIGLDSSLSAASRAGRRGVSTGMSPVAVSRPAVVMPPAPDTASAPGGVGAVAGNVRGPCQVQVQGFAADALV